MKLKTLIATNLVIVSAAICLTITAAWAGTAFYQRDYVKGSMRYCVYDHLGQEYIVTIPSHKMCKMTVKV